MAKSHWTMLVITYGVCWQFLRGLYVSNFRAIDSESAPRESNNLSASPHLFQFQRELRNATKSTSSFSFRVGQGMFLSRIWRYIWGP
jgi:hypothetical protein